MAEHKKPEYGLIQIEPTSRCTLRCTTCLRGSHPSLWQDRDLDPAIFRKLEDVFGRTRAVHLQGWGEPLLHPHLIPFISQVKTAGSQASFTSNGTIMDDDLAHRLLESGVDAITFSMAGAGPLTQDPLRGTGSFDLLSRTLTTLSRVRKQLNTKRPLLAISYLLTPETLNDLCRSLLLCRKWGIHLLAGVHLTHAADEHQLKMHLFSVKEKQQTKKNRRTIQWTATLLALLCRIELRLPADTPSLLPICDKNPIDNLFIAADGSVSPCVFLNPPMSREFTWLSDDGTPQKTPIQFGNLHQEDLDTLWNRESYQAFRKIFQHRVDIYQHYLGKVGYDMDGIEQLEQARKTIRSAFHENPPPLPCRGCTKLLGF